MAYYQLGICQPKNLRRRPSLIKLHTDILICSLPVSSLNFAPAAPALLKSCVEKAGFTAKTADLSQVFYIEISNKNFNLYDHDSSYLLPRHSRHVDSESKVKDWLDLCIKEIKQVNPKFIGLSVFTYYMIRSAYLLCVEIRKHCPNIKIILGGYGLTQSANNLKNIPGIKNIDLIKTFDVFCTEQNLSDYNIIGEGEEALVKILEGSDLEQKNNDAVVLYNVPISNFDNYNLHDYCYATDDITLPVTGSKGCVRQCTFCDIPQKFGKFRYRSGKHIADEIIFLKEKYGVKSFTFTDSLINGSMKALIELTTNLAQYNDTCSINDRIRWSAQYISRPIGQTPEYVYELMARSGAEGLTIGLESGSNNVLKAMNKKVKIEDVDYELEIFEKYGISTTLLFIIGFYNETYDDFLDTIRTIVRYQKYVASGTVLKMDLGIPLTITPETALYYDAHNLEINLNDADPVQWTANNNPSLTLIERIRRRIIAQIVCDQLGIPTGMSGYNIKRIAGLLENESTF